MINIAIFASGNGSNFQNIVEQQGHDLTHGKVRVLIVDKEDAYALQRAKDLHIPSLYVNPKAYPNKASYEIELIKVLQEYHIDLIVLAGFMRILSSTILQAYDKRIINLHPAYLPNFPGKQSILDAYEAHATFSGVTIHYVDEGVDTGVIITQQKIMIDKHDSLDTLTSNIHDLEYKIFPKTIDEVCKQIKESKYEKSID